MLQMCLDFECLFVVEPAEPRRGADLSGSAASEPVRNLLRQPSLKHSVIQIPTQLQMMNKNADLLKPRIQKHDHCKVASVSDRSATT